MAFTDALACVWAELITQQSSLALLHCSSFIFIILNWFLTTSKDLLHLYI